ncbi:hypothetical protein BAE44_0000445 [Dichanthelium oligosanthes]|uniref:Uncharacterized protein n=1 Tax=Dichanthelium oligosanthes TaxID=888268 RepID=A0A1E5WM87_9POAL|nr:hypothetical protein BAE44_0000445 [Dichanthelium oligosanthes]
MRGANWVVDASHCQGCSAQFSLFTRKVISCFFPFFSLAVMVFSTTKAASKPEDEILSEILGGDGVQTQYPRKEFLDSELPGRTASSASASSSSSRRTSTNFSMDANGDDSLSAEAHNYELNNTASIFTPEELRQQAVEEKNRYKTLKSEGKPEEALRAFKHGKELERQAAVLELELRRSKRMAAKTPNVAAISSTPTTDSAEEAETKRSSAGKRVKKENDLASELKELGWSDADLRDETKAAPMSVEGELSQLLREVAPKSLEGKKTGGIDKSQVNALKRQALLLKREGRLAEAKEELKKAKILEKQLEEQEILGDAEDSDDDLVAIIQNMDDDKHDDILMDDPKFPAFNFEQILGASSDLAIDGHFDVTDDDMNDPDMSAALKSFGWSEDDDKQLENHEPVSSSNQEAIKEQVLALKREAVANRRSGNVAEAMSLLKKAKLLEKDLETEEPDSKVPSPEGQKTMNAEDVTFAGTNARPISTSKSKVAIQRELLALKKKALALRREGKVDESDEELKKGSVLEKQLEELENSSKQPVAKETRSFASNPPYKVEPPSLNLADEGFEPEVTDNDMQDPALLSVLKNMGWEDVDTDSAKRTDKPSISSHIVPQKSSRTKGQLQKELLGIKRKALTFRREGKNIEAEEELEKAKVLEQELAEIEESSNSIASEQGVTTAGHQITENKYDVQHVPSVDATVPPSSVRKETKGDDIVPVLASEPGKSVDTLGGSPSKPQIETTDSKQGYVAKESGGGTSSALPQPAFTDPLGSDKGLHSPSEVLDHKEPQKTHRDDTLKDEILLHKRKAVAFKREGKMTEAREELKLAKLLEKRVEGAQQDTVDGGDESTTAVQQSSMVQQPASSRNHTDAVASAPPAQPSKSTQPQKAMSSRDRLKIQRESLAHKRNALKLRREGKTAEADAEFELAKELESQLEEPDNQGSSSGGKSGEPNDAVVEDLLDPQIMSALKSIGWSDMDLSMQSSSSQPLKPAESSIAQPPKRAEAKPAVAASSKPQSERSQLEDEIKAEKLKALNLKREGKQAEALEALRSAKRLEKKLASLG